MKLEKVTMKNKSWILEEIEDANKPTKVEPEKLEPVLTDKQKALAKREEEIKKIIAKRLEATKKVAEETKGEDHAILGKDIKVKETLCKGRKEVGILIESLKEKGINFFVKKINEGENRYKVIYNPLTEKTLKENDCDNIDIEALEWYVKNYSEGDNITVTADLLNVLEQSLEMYKKHCGKEVKEDVNSEIDAVKYWTNEVLFQIDEYTQNHELKELSNEEKTNIAKDIAHNIVYNSDNLWSYINDTIRNMIDDATYVPSNESLNESEVKELKRESCSKWTKPTNEDIEEWDPDFEICCKDVANGLDSGWWHGQTSSERSWSLSVNGGDGNQFSPLFADVVAYEVSYPVRDGVFSFDGLDCVPNKSTFSYMDEEDWKDESKLETLRNDLISVGCDEEEIEKFFKDEISEIEFFINFEIDIDDLDEDEDEEVLEAAKKPINKKISSPIKQIKEKSHKGPFEIEYWVDEEARDMGFGDIYLEIFDDLEEAKEVADSLFGEVASVEVLDANGQVVYGRYPEDESFSKKTIKEEDEVARVEYCVMDKFDNNIECFEKEEEAIEWAKDNDGFRVLEVSYGPRDDYGDEEELGCVEIWSLENEDESLKEEKINIDYVVSLFGDDSHYYNEDDEVRCSPDISGATKFNKKKDISILGIVRDVCESQSKYMPENEAASLFDLDTLEEVYEKDEDYFISSGLVKIIPIYKNKKIELPESKKEKKFAKKVMKPGVQFDDDDMNASVSVNESEAHALIGDKPIVEEGKSEIDIANDFSSTVMNNDALKSLEDDDNI